MEIKIGNRAVGDAHPVYLIAEIGSNHNQRLELAYEHIDAAADAGVDAVKFQTFRAASHFSVKAPEADYLKGVDLHKLIESLEINRDWHPLLQTRCKSRGVEFLSSPCDADAIEQLHALGMAAMKVASFDMTDLGLIGLIARTGRTVILSTGMADWMEISRAVDVCRTERNPNIVLLQCTSLYPAPVELSNLRAISLMRQAFGVLTGYSDHTLGDHVPVASVAMGACMIEKHFTMNRMLPGPDHSFAMEPAELKTMVQRVRDVERALGDGAKAGPRVEERDMYDKARRSLHAARAIAAGERITENDLTVKRPGLGIPPYLMGQVVGRVARRDIDADQWITWDHI